MLVKLRIIVSIKISFKSFKFCKILIYKILRKVETYHMCQLVYMFIILEYKLCTNSRRLNLELQNDL